MRALHSTPHRNLGCGARVSSGLDWVFDAVDEAIVIEDDCLPHPSFFPFAEAMLARYRDDERIGMVAGTNYFSDRRAAGAGSSRTTSPSGVGLMVTSMAFLTIAR